MLKIKSLLIENASAVKSFNVDFPFDEGGLPKPLILVGENGSGKTTTLSFVVDSLFQIASAEFGDVLARDGDGSLYYRIRNGDISVGANYSVAVVRYHFNDEEVCCVDRVGGDVGDLRVRLGLPNDIGLDATASAEKCVTPNVGQAAKAIRDGAYIFFPSGRREVPHWLQEKALHTENYSNKRKFNNYIYKSLVVETAAEQTANWIMDGLLDNAAGYKDAGILMANKLIKLILEDSNVHFAVAPRNIWPRVQIYSLLSADGGEGNLERRLLIPSLGNLSAGQSMLLSMFGTIANQGTLHKRKQLHEIEGVVIIDEIEVYLHTRLQRVVLPKLMRLFPKVQFIVSTHSAAFLMGMRDEFGVDGFEVCDMPSGARIDVDQFSEIGAAVEALSQSTAFRSEVRSQVARENERPLLIVEGKSDAILIEGLWKLANNEVPPFRIMTAKGRRGLRYLLEDEQFVGEVGSSQRVLGLFDFDEAFDDWSGCGKLYVRVTGSDECGLLKKHTQKKIYAGLLPVPSHRTLQAGERFSSNSSLTIELYVPDCVLEAGQNLECVTFPGDVKISRFRGDKVAFAERIGSQLELLSYFEVLLEMIRRVLLAEPEI